MTTVADVVAIQSTDNVLLTPVIPDPVPVGAIGAVSMVAETASTLTINLANQTSTNTAYAYVTGIATANNSALCILQADGKTPYYPANPSAVGTALAVNCAIPLGPIGSTVSITIPQLAGGRVWFVQDGKLTFLLNPGGAGAGLAEPSVSNPSDPSYNLTWDFCEFTYNTAQIYANITYVDFVCIPVALTLTNQDGTTAHVSGIPAGALDTICNNLTAQNNSDGAGWNKLIIQSGGKNLRAVSPTNGITLNPGLFSNYWTSYINSVWSHYQSNNLSVDTQNTWGTLTGRTSSDGNTLQFGSVGGFTKPNATDIFGAASGAFAAQANNTAELLAVGARLDAAINRSTLLSNANQPDGEVASTYYKNSVTNHYARIVHAANLDGRGYCHPYDDVSPSGVTDQSGFVSSPTPQNLLITIGGANAHTKMRRRKPLTEGNVQAGRWHGKRSLGWEADVKEEPVAMVELDRDLELGQHPKMLNELTLAPAAVPSWKFPLPAPVERFITKHLTAIRENPLYAEKLLPLITIMNQIVISFLSLSLRALLSRVFVLAFVLILYFSGMVPYTSSPEVQQRIIEGANVVNATLSSPELLTLQ